MSRPDKHGATKGVCVLLGVIVVSGVPGRDVASWATADVPLVVAGIDAGPELVGWVRETELSHVLVIASQPSPAEADVMATTLAASLPHVAVARATSPGAPLALAAAAHLALTAPGEPDSPALRVERIAELSSQSMSGAWVRSVTRLERPRPRFLQHLSSMFRKGFVVTVAPEETVVRIPPDTKHAAEAASQPGAGTGPETSSQSVLLIGGEKDTTEYRQLVHHLEQPHDRAVPAVGSARERYGAPAVEFVVMDESSMPQGDLLRCSVCQDLCRADFCPFCHARSLPQEIDQ